MALKLVNSLFGSAFTSHNLQLLKHSSKFHTCKLIMSRQVLLKDVVDVLKQSAPLSLAESWDNVGLLVEPSHPHRVNKILLTNDLTEEVMVEAIEKSVNVIVSYHPPLFSSIKRLVQNKWKDRIVVKALENRIAIYSPHTCYDAVRGGVNDWLISCFDGDVQPVSPIDEGSEDGAGRICILKEPLSIEEVLFTVKKHLNLAHLRVARSPSISKVQKIACCAGSGASVLRGVEADVYLTGEMSHHETLDAIANNAHVILCEHSNTERGFLKVLAPNLKALLEHEVDVIVSERDHDPLVIV